MYRDDEEDKDLDSWLASQASTAQVPAPAQPQEQEQTDLNSVLKTLTQRVMAGDKQDSQQKYLQGLWNKAESQSLQKLTGDQSTENWAVGLGTAIPLLAGVLADSLTPNAYGVRGTGLGKIAEAGVANAGQMLAQQQQRKAQAQGLAEAAAGIRRSSANTDFDRLSGLARQISEARRIDQQDVALGLRGRGVEMKGTEQSFRLDPNNPQAVATRELIVKYNPALAGKLDALGMTGLQSYVDEASKNADFANELRQRVTLAGQTAAAGEQGRQGVQHAWAPVVAQDAAAEKSLTTRASVAAEREAQAANRPAPAGYVVDDQAVFNNTNEDTTQRGKMATIAASGHLLKEAAKEIRDLRAKYGTEALPSAASTQVEMKKNLLIGQLNSLANAGVLNPGERVNWDKIIPGLNGSWTDVITSLGGRDLRLDQLEGLTAAVDSLVGSAASQYGLKYVGLQQAREARQQSGSVSKWAGQKQSGTQPAAGAASKWAKNKR